MKILQKVDCASHGGLADLFTMTGDVKLKYKQP